MTNAFYDSSVHIRGVHQHKWYWTFTVVHLWKRAYSIWQSASVMNCCRLRKLRMIDVSYFGTLWEKCRDNSLHHCQLEFANDAGPNQITVFWLRDHQAHSRRIRNCTWRATLKSIWSTFDWFEAIWIEGTWDLVSHLYDSKESIENNLFAKIVFHRCIYDGRPFE